jgi:hypothetical protein
MFFLYQLVNLVLETCFIFSKTLKLSKTFSSWISRFVLSFEQRAVMIPLFQIISRNSFSRKCHFLSIWGYFTKSVVVSILDFSWHISFRKMFEWMTCKRNHNFESWALCKTIKNRYHGLGWKFPVSWSPCRECRLFKRLRDMVLVSGQNEVLLLLLSLFFDVKKQCLFQEQ